MIDFDSEHLTPAEQACERMIDRTRKSYHELLVEFVDNHCVGKEYDSCYEAPCFYASKQGCLHPEHPKRRNDDQRHRKPD